LPSQVRKVLNACDRRSGIGRRDYAILWMLARLGLRASEVATLTLDDVDWQAGQLSVQAKGRQRAQLPLPHSPNANGGRLSPDAVQAMLAKHVVTARRLHPSLARKRISPHVLRHSAAMELLQAGVDCSVIALWLGREWLETTQVYLHAHLALKEAALAKLHPLKGKTAGRFRPGDQLLAFLKGLEIFLTMPRDCSSASCNRPTSAHSPQQGACHSA